MSSLIAQAKQTVLHYQHALDTAATGARTRAALAAHLSENHVYRGVHPFHDIQGTQALADTVYSPLKAALPVQCRRSDIVLAGHHHLDESAPLWVVSMGHILGDFTQDWLGITPSRKAAYLPYVTFYRVQDGQIAETVEFFDILALMTQAGQNPLIEHQTAAQFMAPAPRTQDGQMTGEAAPAASCASMDLTRAMIDELAQTLTSPEGHMERFWHADMAWYGPTGIGSCFGFEGYRRGHTGPFEAKLAFLDYTPEHAATAEGSYAAFLWYPSLQMRNHGDASGGFMGLPPHRHQARCASSISTAARVTS